MEINVGVRVVRGPDWKWSNQDDGEGHCGTVVEIGKPGSHTTPDKTVVVQWDSGSRTNYRIGYQNAYDLRVVDNAPIGVRHPNIICNACKKHGIAGMRWKCLICQGVDLCTLCYMNDKHDLNHTFARYEAHSVPGVEMMKRSSKNNIKIQSRGIFVGARVVRGYDWDWANQDGGEGKMGKVIDIRGWDNESRRSVANVMWVSGSTNVYRVGHKGKVDLKYTVDSPGLFYYRNHLPILGQQIEGTNRSSIARSISIASESQKNSVTALFNVGDKVKVIIEDVNELKSLQEGHGGWNQRMAEFIGHIGTVHRVTDRADIRVQFEGCHNRWTFNPIALSKVISYSVGDIVKVCDDVNKVKELQRSHGEWNDHMLSAIGKMGKIVKVYEDHDLRVTVNGETWTFNPECVALMPGSATEMNNTMISHPTKEETNSRLGNLLEPEPTQASSSSEPQQEGVSSSTSSASERVKTPREERLVRASAQNRFDVVKDIIDRHPELVNCKLLGKTPLQCATYQGHIVIVNFLLESNADVNLRDDEGDTALHYAAFGNQSEILKLLLTKGSEIDAINKTQCTALHIAVNKNYINCVRFLLEFDCNVNLLDSYGDTPLHDAIGKVDNLETIDALVSSPRINLSLKNRKGFNLLHHSSLKGNNFATEKILTISRQLVDSKKDDGFAALHLATLNGHYKVAETLIVQGQADINIVNNRKQTALMLAISQQYCGIVELLVRNGADSNQVNEDNDSSLHVALIKCRDQLKSETCLENAPTISEIMDQLSSIGFEKCVYLSIACYLVREANADIKLKNRRGKTGLNLLEIIGSMNRDTNTAQFDYNLGKDFILGLVESRNSRSQNSHVRADTHTTPVDDVLNGSQSELESTSVMVNSNETPISFVVDINSGEKLSQSKSQECIICSELKANVIFYPCNHSVLCELCAVRIKKCIKCSQTITAKLVKDNNKQLIQTNNISDKSNHSKVGNHSNTKTTINNRNNNNNNQKSSLLDSVSQS